jgi:hypothetical protein
MFFGTDTPARASIGQSGLTIPRSQAPVPHGEPEHAQETRFLRPPAYGGGLCVVHLPGVARGLELAVNPRAKRGPIVSTGTR